MDCPDCDLSMVEPGPQGNRHCCYRCGRVAATGETVDDITIRERGRQEAFVLLDYAMALRGECRTRAPREDLPMGQLIQTRGCGKCGGTMYRTVETDGDGNPTQESQFVCSACGHIE
ncbi:hypothetical protein ACFU90_24700 [Streptomyces noursei]|uniref:Uncharacterized protein n=1 Tax=Streptomyces noursei TaxID=1971 RepID=A0A059VZH7_STRNR|nr:hypothetical protein [Streptomyces noursei]AKA08411.1 hypothetical protein SAZ_02855 [Streptomyces noursei ZPM]AIA01001.1 hypothetical protein DC74_475 [Streptomyces noursei]EPY92222.1 hypothetical protein K530_54425 [Streptomyces noursei CCRC 11814]EXU92161.1 hypothetical protein P354_29610 [Streptomyces noursei PD-1]MCZ0975031.1 hypothetical protein [Streptomyces noursei]